MELKKCVRKQLKPILTNTRRYLNAWVGVASEVLGLIKAMEGQGSGRFSPPQMEADHLQIYHRGKINAIKKIKQAQSLIFKNLAGWCSRNSGYEPIRPLKFAPYQDLVFPQILRVPIQMHPKGGRHIFYCRVEILMDCQTDMTKTLYCLILWVQFPSQIPRSSVDIIHNVDKMARQILSSHSCLSERKGE